jgi:hypothetical protein
MDGRCQEGKCKSTAKSVARPQEQRKDGSAARSSFRGARFAFLLC